MNEAAHARLLLSILRERWDEAAAWAGHNSLLPQEFVDLCRSTDVPTHVHELLQSRDRWSLVGPEVQAGLKRARDKVRRDNLLLLARAEHALELLLGAGIVPVALKGLDTLHRFYGNFDERTLDDVDLLIPRTQLQAAVDVLCNAGWTLPAEPTALHYIRSSHHLPIVSPGPVTVDFEVHWNLAQEGRYAIDATALLERAIPFELFGRTILRLEDHDLVAHLLVHHQSHYFDRRLKWMVDLQAIVRQPNFRWETVVERVREWKARVASSFCLLHMNKVWPELIDQRVLRELWPAGWRRALAAPLRSHHPLELFRGTRARWVQLYIAALLLDRPSMLPAWLLHRAVRDRQPSANPLDSEAASKKRTGPFSS